MSGRRDDAAMPNESVTREHPSDRPLDPRSSDAAHRPSVVPAHPSGLTIIGSKIGPAAPARSILARPRLVEWFGQHADACRILVNADAGYGKTTLLGEFAEYTRDRVVWYRLERSDRRFDAGPHR